MGFEKIPWFIFSTKIIQVFFIYFSIFFNQEKFFNGVDNISIIIFHLYNVYILQ